MASPIRALRLRLVKPLHMTSRLARLRIYPWLGGPMDRVASVRTTCSGRRVTPTKEPVRSSLLTKIMFRCGFAAMSFRHLKRAGFLYPLG